MPSASAICAMAKENEIFLVGGSIPESEDSPSSERKIYNTSIVVNPQGSIIAKYRKVCDSKYLYEALHLDVQIHLFDIDVPGKIRFKESDTLCGGLLEEGEKKE